MGNFSVWISSMRLRTLPLSVSGIILGTFIAAKQGFYDWRISTLAILTTVSFQILSNLANDYGDGVKGTDNKDRIGPERAIQSGKISDKQMKNGIVINVVISLVLSMLTIYFAFRHVNFLLSLIFFFLGIASIIAAIKYTVGKSAYGYYALGDVFVFIFFGLLSVIGSYVLYAKAINSITILPAIIIGLLSVAVLNLNNMRDIDSDKKSNKITLAVKLGIQKAKVYHYSLVMLSILLSMIFGFLIFKSILNVIFVVAFIPLILHLKTITKITNPVLFDPELKKVALSTFLLAILMGFCILF